MCGDNLRADHIAAMESTPRNLMMMASEHLTYVFKTLRHIKTLVADLRIGKGATITIVAAPNVIEAHNHNTRSSSERCSGSSKMLQWRSMLLHLV